jgi:hypothetical protein
VTIESIRIREPAPHFSVPSSCLPGLLVSISLPLRGALLSKAHLGEITGRQEAVNCVTAGLLGSSELAAQHLSVLFDARDAAVEIDDKHFAVPILTERRDVAAIQTGVRRT